MTNEQFCDCLRRLKLTRASARSAAALGISVRQLQRIAAGQAPVSPTLSLLVIAYLKLGVPAVLWNTDLSRTDVIQQATARLMETFRRDGRHP
jgi:transcriptional regulator with XRE-family HTH domain